MQVSSKPRAWSNWLHLGGRSGGGVLGEVRTTQGTHVSYAKGLRGARALQSSDSK